MWFGKNILWHLSQLIHATQVLLDSISTSMMVLTNVSSKAWQNMENPIIKCTATCYCFIGREWSCSFLIQNTRHSRKVMIHRFFDQSNKLALYKLLLHNCKSIERLSWYLHTTDDSVMFRIITYFEGNYISVRRKRFLTGKVFYLYFMFFCICVTNRF